LRDTRDKAILYWFGPPQSKTLRPVLDCIDVSSVVLGGTTLGALYWPAEKFSGPESMLVKTEKPISSWLQYGGLSELP
jgi:hypothetical protein